METGLATFVLTVGLFAGTFFGAGVMNHVWAADVIERGMGLYCPTDGAFAFVGECGK